MKDKEYYYNKMFKGRKITFCVRLFKTNGNTLVTRVGMAITSPLDKHSAPKGKMIARNRTETRVKVVSADNSNDNIKVTVTRTPFIYEEYIPNGYWRGIDFKDHAKRAYEIACGKLENNPTIYIKSLANKNERNKTKDLQQRRAS